jgi:DNA repair ATPase RecN
MLSCHRYRFLPVTAVLISFLAYGCSESRTAQCNKLNKIANRAKTLTPPKNAASFNQISEAVDSIGLEMRALKLEDSKLKDFQARFNNIYNESSEAARNISQAYSEKKPEAAIAKIGKEVKSISDREISLIRDVNKYCAGQ